MNLPHRIYLLSRLGEYILSGEAGWQEAVEKAGYENGWFIPEFVEKAAKNIALSFLQKDRLEAWTRGQEIAAENPQPGIVGIVMAGNIPLVGFHDWLSVFISGHKARVKPSSRDQVLIRHLLEKMAEWDIQAGEQTEFAEMLRGCDAYIATGSNNSSRYFEYYFGKYPHIIRKNRTSVAILSGNETRQELEGLADDVYLYFGLGCRNVTKIYVPGGYDFVPLLEAFGKYNYLAEHHKYKNNYDYNLALHLLNKQFYMTNGSLLLVENPALFSPISQLNYEYYRDADKLTAGLQSNQELQSITGKGFLPFGQSQYPGISDYADGINTLAFLDSL
ncbi:MAG: acyl-CoA reductase [Sphingobacteriales bacterium]|nr:acyl-CoA reductase [Sphingobacteriales bacterium]